VAYERLALSASTSPALASGEAAGPKSVQVPTAPPTETYATRGRLVVIGAATTPDSEQAAVTARTSDAAVALIANRDRWRADTMLDPLGMFLLQRIAERDGGVSFGELADNFDGVDGWVIIARLLRAGLLDENGLSVYATSSGRNAAVRTESLAPRGDGTQA
jgi:hypothetical protein